MLDRLAIVTDPSSENINQSLNCPAYLSAVVRSIVEIVSFFDRLIAGAKIGEFTLRDDNGGRRKADNQGGVQGTPTKQREPIPNGTQSKAN